MEEVEATGGEAVRALEVRDARSGEVLYAGWGTTTFLERLRGLMFRRSLAPGECLFITPCYSVHTFFMMFPIDVLYLGEDGTVLAIDGSVAPWRLGGFHALTRSVLEVPAESCPVLPGARLEIRDRSRPNPTLTWDH